MQHGTIHDCMMDARAAKGPQITTYVHTSLLYKKGKGRDECDDDSIRIHLTASYLISIKAVKIT